MPPHIRLTLLLVTLVPIAAGCASAPRPLLSTTDADAIATDPAPYRRAIATCLPDRARAETAAASILTAYRTHVPGFRAK